MPPFVLIASQRSLTCASSPNSGAGPNSDLHTRGAKTRVQMALGNVNVSRIIRSRFSIFEPSSLGPRLRAIGGLAPSLPQVTAQYNRVISVINSLAGGPRIVYDRYDSTDVDLRLRV